MATAAKKTSVPDSELDRRFMASALRLGRRNLGQTYPNPAVGAVIVQHEKDGPVVVGHEAVDLVVLPVVQHALVDAEQVLGLGGVVDADRRRLEGERADRRPLETSCR